MTRTTKKIVECRVVKDKLLTYGYSHGYIKWKGLILKFDDGQTMHIDYWGPFYRYIIRELNASHEPSIRVNQVWRLPLSITYDTNHKFYCSFMSLTLLSFYAIVSIGAVTGLLL